MLRITEKQKNLSVSNDDVLNNLFVQITNLSDMRTVPVSDDILIGKIISSMRDVLIFSVVCRNPPDELQALIAVLSRCVREAGRAQIRNGITEIKETHGQRTTTITDSLGYIVDRKIHNLRSHAPIRGHGKGPGGSLRGPHVCIIVTKKAAIRPITRGLLLCSLT